MTTEIQPHRVHSRIDGQWTETRAPDFPADLDPYGDTPFETDIVKDEVKSYIGFFKCMLCQGTNEKSPEANVVVDLNSKDDSGRPIPVQIHVDFITSRMADGQDETRVETNRLFLYENGVAIKKVWDWSITDDRWEETLLSQAFVTEADLPTLEFARKVIYASPAYPKR